VLGARWLFAGRQLAGIVRQRKVLERDLAKATGGFTR